MSLFSTGPGSRIQRPAPVVCASTVLVLLASVSVLQAAPQFPEPGFRVGLEPWDVATADFNRDGIGDLVVANVGANSTQISVLLGRGDGTFQAETRYVSGEGPQSVACGDFNADGIVDLAVANIRSNDVSILLGAGDGTFGAPTRYPVGTSPNTIIAGDWNGDSRVDLAVANLQTADFSILLGMGDGTLSPEARYPTGSNPYGIASGDFNGDGVRDLALTTLGIGLSVHLGNGDGTFGPEIRTSYATSLQRLAVGDFNADGLQDLAVSDSIFLGRGDGTFQLRAQYPAPVNDVAVTDLDGDGVLDLIALTPDVLSIRLGSGDGSFGAAKQFAAGGGSRHLALGDFDGDGRLDIALTSQSDALVLVLRGLGGGDFGPQIHFSTGRSPVAVAAADLNRDGHVDLVVANSGNSDAAADDVSVLLGRGDGSFGPQVRYPAGDTPSSVVVADFNGDGKKDMATANKTDLSIFLGRGDGTFGPQTSVPAGASPVCIAAGDLDGDGRVDLAVCNGSGNTVTFLRGLGDGSFATWTSLTAQGSPKSVAITDMTGDGLADLLIALNIFHFPTTSSEIHLRRGQGGGAFGPPEVVTNQFNDSMVVQDLNGDGRPDVAGSAGAKKLVCAVLGTGNGSFAAAGCFSSGVNPAQVTVGDINGDGLQDLVAVNHGNSSNTSYVALHFGDGSGGFPFSSMFLAGPSSPSIVVADFDENGSLDLAVSSRTNNEVWILRNSAPVATCDPPGPPPRFGCQWSTDACDWICPVCDPFGAPPRSSCSWDGNLCNWICPGYTGTDVTVQTTQPPLRDATVYVRLSSLCTATGVLASCAGSFPVYPGMTVSQKCQAIADVIANDCPAAGYAVTVNDCGPEASLTASNLGCPGTQFALGLSNDPAVFDQAGSGALPDGEAESTTGTTASCSPMPGPVSNLLLTPVGDGEILLAWDGASNADDYLVFTDAAPNGTFVSAVGRSPDGATGLTILAPPLPAYYLVAGRNATCGLGQRH